MRRPRRGPLHNLPTQRTRLIGRESDVSAVRQLVLDGDGHMVTLTGPGGCGKSRLALQVGFDLVHVFPDGVWLVELAPVADGALVEQSVAAALGVTHRPAQAMLEAVVANLRTRELLLVVDNCEHLVEASARLAEHLLASCPGVRILATSRERLRISSEVAWPVAPLAVPNPRQPVTRSEDVAEYASARLFVERARAAQPTFELTAGNAAAVARICATLEGLPLALELAAARIRVLTPEQIAARLDDVFRILVAGSRTAPGRQQTLRATFDWSAGLLSAPELALFRRLSVFAGGWALDAAESVCADDPIEPDHVLALLEELIEKSLVLAEAMPPRPQEMRYRLLEPTRQYAFERLQRSPDLPSTERRHTAYFLRLVTEGEELWRGAWESGWLARLDLELDNIRAALRRALDENPDAFVRMCVRLTRFWEVRGYLEEGERWLSAAVVRLDSWPPRLQMSALRQATLMAGFRGEWDRFESLRQRWFAVALELGERFAMAEARTLAAWYQWIQGDLDRAAALMEEALPFWRAQKERDRAATAIRRAEAKAAGATLWDWDDLAIGSIVLALGWIYLERGDLEQAGPLLDEDLDLARAGGDAVQVAEALAGQAWLAHLDGHPRPAVRLARQALASVHELGHRGAVRFCLDLLGCLAAAQGHVERAGRLFGAAQAVHQTTHASTAYGRPLANQRERAVAALRCGPRAASFSAAWDEGSALSLDKAVAYAMADEEPVEPRRTLGPPDAGRLSQREWEVAAGVARGLTNRQIAAELIIAEGTADRHVSNILAKLRLRSRAQLAVWAVEQGARLPT